MSEPELLGTRARRVTFYEDRAEVERLARVDLTPGRHSLSLEGCTPLMDDRTLRVGVRSGDAKVISASVRRLPEAQEEAMEALDARLMRTREETRLERDAAARARGAEQRTFSLVEQWLEGLRRAPEAPGTFDGRDWREGFDALFGALLASGQDFVEHSFGLEQGELATRALSGRRHDQARDRPCGRLLVDVQLSATQPGPVELELSYRTPSALWRPVHSARLVRTSEESRSGTVELVTSVVAWQSTGETWSDVEARFSTLRPATSGRAPALSPESERPAVASTPSAEPDPSEARLLPVSGLLGTAGDVIDELPGLSDGGEPVNYSASIPLSVPSDGRPHRFKLEERVLDARLSRALLPERSPQAHLVASLDWMHRLPLLAGPLALMRGQDYLGTSRIDLVLPGDRFEIGFGPEEGLLATRRVEESRERVPVLGSQKLRRLVSISVQNRSTVARTVRVTERIPVSDTPEVDVMVTELGDWSAVDAEGFVTIELGLAPGGSQELRLAYELRVRPKVELPF